MGTQKNSLAETVLLSSHDHVFDKMKENWKQHFSLGFLSLSSDFFTHVGLGMVPWQLTKIMSPWNSTYNRPRWVWILRTIHTAGQGQYIYWNPSSNRSPYIFTLVQKVKHRVYKIHAFFKWRSNTMYFAVTLQGISFKMMFTSCTYEVREKVTLVSKSHTFSTI